MTSEWDKRFGSFPRGIKLTEQCRNNGGRADGRSFRPQDTRSETHTHPSLPGKERVLLFRPAAFRSNSDYDLRLACAFECGVESMLLLILGEQQAQRIGEKWKGVAQW